MKEKLIDRFRRYREDPEEHRRILAVEMAIRMSFSEDITVDKVLRSARKIEAYFAGEEGSSEDGALHVLKCSKEEGEVEDAQD